MNALVYLAPYQLDALIDLEREQVDRARLLSDAQGIQTHTQALDRLLRAMPERQYEATTA